MHISDGRTPRTSRPASPTRIKDNTGNGVNGADARKQRSLSLGGSKPEDSAEMQERMKHTRDFKKKGFKGNSRGHFIQAPFTTLEEMFKKLPESIGFNIEMSAFSITVSPLRILLILYAMLTSFDQNTPCSTNPKNKKWTPTPSNSTPSSTPSSPKSTILAKNATSFSPPSIPTSASCSPSSSLPFQSSSSPTPEPRRSAISEPVVSRKPSGSLVAGTCSGLFVSRIRYVWRRGWSRWLRRVGWCV